METIVSIRVNAYQIPPMDTDLAPLGYWAQMVGLHLVTDFSRGVIHVFLASDKSYFGSVKSGDWIVKIPELEVSMLLNDEEWEILKCRNT